MTESQRYDSHTEKRMSSKEEDADEKTTASMTSSNNTSEDKVDTTISMMTEGTCFFFIFIPDDSMRKRDDVDVGPTGTDIAAMIDDDVPPLPPEGEEEKEEEVEKIPPASTRTKHDWIIYAPHWTAPKKEYGSFFIEAKQKTFLKDRPDMSWTLKDHEKIECVKGRKYEIESELIAVENEFLHKKIVLVKDSILDQ